MEAEVKKEINSPEMERVLYASLLEDSKTNQAKDIDSSQFETQNFISEDPDCSSSQENVSSKDSIKGHVPDSHHSSIQDEGDGCSLKYNAAVDSSVDSISQNESTEGCWGSVSDPPTPLSAQTTTNMSIQTLEESSDREEKKGMILRELPRPASNELIEPPSFMTLVEPVNRLHASPEMHTSSPSRAGWFPSLTNVATIVSQERKRNEEVISKVSNWSSQKAGTSLNHILVEANIGGKNSLWKAQELKKSAAAQEGQKSDLPTASTATAKAVHSKEYSSPVRFYDRKGDKRKFWAPFMCCSSIK